MESDAEGFAYPSVDASTCIDCGRCERVCPFLRPPAGAPVLQTYAARTLDQALLMGSSSGGVFTELATPVIEAGGAVYGVVMDADCRGCSLVRAYGMGGVAPMRGSKYLQADSRGVYSLVDADLAAGRRVLFSGTPCQANALVLYLGGKPEGLLLVDCVCHGVPSPALWAACVDDAEARAGAPVTSVSFRCKEEGWRRFGLRSEAGGSARFEPLDESPYLRMFLRDVCLRPSCYACRAKEARAADVTLADFWGIEDVLPDVADDLGWSLVLARTDKGAEALGASGLALVPAPYAEAVARNPAEHRSAARPPERDRFFGDLAERGYAETARRYGGVGARERARRVLKAALARAGLLRVVRKMRG